jgi:hypothetical protein
MRSKVNSSYPEMIQWLHAFLGDDELASAMFLPLCSGAFETTNRVRAFAELGHRSADGRQGAAAHGSVCSYHQRA